MYLKTIMIIVMIMQIMICTRMKILVQLGTGRREPWERGCPITCPNGHPILILNRIAANPRSGVIFYFFGSSLLLWHEREKNNALFP